MDTTPQDHPGRWPDFYLISPPKCATRWTFASLRDHPDVYLPPIKCVDFFTIHYHKGEGWYRRKFNNAAPNAVVGDYTHNYLQSPVAYRRIREHHPEAQFVCCLRQPVERAFSFYWHLKSTGRIQYDFAEVLERYELFQQLIEPGFYDLHLERFFEHFPRENFLVLLVDDLARDDAKFIRRVYSFLGVDPSHRPDTLGRTINQSRFDKSGFAGRIYDRVRSTALDAARRLGVDFVSPLSGTSFFQTYKQWVLSREEYERGMDREVQKELMELYAPHVESLSSLIDRDLTDWMA